MELIIKERRIKALGYGIRKIRENYHAIISPAGKICLEIVELKQGVLAKNKEKASASDVIVVVDVRQKRPVAICGCRLLSSGQSCASLIWALD